MYLLSPNQCGQQGNQGSHTVHSVAHLSFWSGALSPWWSDWFSYLKMGFWTGRRISHGLWKSQLIWREEVLIAHDEQPSSLAPLCHSLPCRRVMHELGRVRLQPFSFWTATHCFPLLPLVPSHGIASVQVLRDLCLSHFLLHLYRADSRVTKVSACGSPLGFLPGTVLLAHCAQGCEKMGISKSQGLCIIPQWWWKG